MLKNFTRLMLLSVFLHFSQLVKADFSSSFIVYGDVDKYYPVTFSDGNWFNNRATVLELGRSDVHTDATIRGAMIAKFEYHTNNWGHGAQFINSRIYENSWIPNPDMVAGWVDVTNSNGNKQIVIWLKGGSTTYFYTANADVNPIVYDGIQNALPFHEENGPAYSYKTSIDSYVSSNGTTLNGNLNVFEGINIGNVSTLPQFKLAVKGSALFDTQGTGSVVIGNANTTTDSFTSMLLSISEVKNGFSSIQSVKGAGMAWGNLILNRYGGNVGIGTVNPTQKLAVDGTVLAKKVKVSQSAIDWPDYVFDSSYQLPSLDSVAGFIQTNKHLPDMPSAASVEKDGHDLGEVQKQLLKKVEELTLYVIELKKENNEMKDKINKLEKSK